jgi:hypothetical protein
LAARASVSLVVVALGSGCASVPEPSPSGYEVTFITYIDYLIESATEQGASSTQLDILRKTRDIRDITFEDLDRATQDTFAYFESAGIEYSRSVSEGLNATITYSFASPDGDSRVADSCILKYSEFIERDWTSRPAAFEPKNAYIITHRDELVACLRERGADIDDDATADELRQAARLTEEEQEAWEKGLPTREDCFYAIGLTSF